MATRCPRGGRPHFLRPLAGAVAVQSRRVEAVRRREKSMGEKSVCTRGRVVAARASERVDGYSSEQCCDEEAHHDMSRLYSVVWLAASARWVELAALVAAMTDRSLRNHSAAINSFARQIYPLTCSKAQLR